MQTLQDQFRNAECNQLEAALRACVATVFERCPALCGFSVGERSVSSEGRNWNGRESELYLSDVTVSAQLAQGQSEQCHDEVARALGDFLNERPDAADLLTGRTFARSWH